MSMGPFVREFEQTFARYVGTEYSVATNSCTSALEIALRTVGVGPGNEVVIPCQTFFATGAAVAKAGATPVCCEISRDFLLDFKHLQKIVTPKTKAVILVHFAGLIHADVFEMRDWLQEQGIALIEDCAHAHGAFRDPCVARCRCARAAACLDMGPSRWLGRGKGVLGYAYETHTVGSHSY